MQIALVHKWCRKVALSTTAASLVSSSAHLQGSLDMTIIIVQFIEIKLDNNMYFFNVI